jgi:hypothetical protein
MIAVHRRVVAVLRRVLVGAMMISVNGTLVAAAARTCDGHQSRTGNRRINQEYSKETDPCRDALSTIKNGLGRMFHIIAVEHSNHTPNAAICVASQIAFVPRREVIGGPGNTARCDS